MRPRLLAASFVASASALAAVAAAAAAPPPVAPTATTTALSASACEGCQTGVPDVAGGSVDSFLAIWRGVTTFTVTRRLFDGSGNGSGDVTVGPSGQVDLGGITGDGDGWLLLWFQPGRVSTQRVGADGAGGHALQINETGLGDDHGTAQERTGDGALAVWSRTTPGDAPDQVVARRVGLDGVPAGDEHVVGEVLSRTSAAACGFANGRSVVVWTTYAWPPVTGPAPTGVALRRLNPDGSPLGPVVVVAAPTLTDFITASTVACRPDGSFIVAWNTNKPPAKSGFDALWLRFDANGKAKGKPASLSASTAGDELEPALLARADGTVLAVWNEASADGGGVLTGRWIGKNGKPAGAQFPLYDSEAGQAPHRPRLAELPGSGRLVLGWGEELRGRVQIFRF
jgi:hypothetical protein